jgi:hypothetical protein
MADARMRIFGLETDIISYISCIEFVPPQQGESFRKVNGGSVKDEGTRDGQGALRMQRWGERMRKQCELRLPILYVRHLSNNGECEIYQTCFHARTEEDARAHTHTVTVETI